MSLHEDWYNPEWWTAWKYYPCVITLSTADIKRPSKLGWHYFFAAKRDQLAGGLAKIGFDVIDSQGTYFLTVDYRPLGFNGDDVEFCKHLTIDAGVAAVPFSAFYQGGLERGVNHFARFCYCKQDSLLDAAIDKLGKHFGGI